MKHEQPRDSRRSAAATSPAERLSAVPIAVDRGNRDLMARRRGTGSVWQNGTRRVATARRSPNVRSGSSSDRTLLKQQPPARSRGATQAPPTPVQARAALDTPVQQVQEAERARVGARMSHACRCRRWAARAASARGWKNRRSDSANLGNKMSVEVRFVQCRREDARSCSTPTHALPHAAALAPSSCR